MNRRTAIAALAASGIAASQTDPNGMPYRVLGKTKEKVSAIGLGGYHLGHPPDPAVAVAIVRSAVDRGINFMDNCWDYHLGTSELRAGKAYKEGGYRDKVFQMTKIDGRTKKAAARQIGESLARLQTDHIHLNTIFPLWI